MMRVSRRTVIGVSLLALAALAADWDAAAEEHTGGPPPGRGKDGGHTTGEDHSSHDTTDSHDDHTTHDDSHSDGHDSGHDSGHDGGHAGGRRGGGEDGRRGPSLRADRAKGPASARGGVETSIFGHETSFNHD